MNDVLIDVAALRARLGKTGLRIADTRFDLADTGKGDAAYRAAHLPDAIRADLDRDLSDHARRGLGRHPLPESAAFARWLASVGYAPDQTWVIYDDGNASFAARLWWMLKAIGHRDARVLNGGYAAWIAVGAAVTDVVPAVTPTTVVAAFNAAAMRDVDALERLRSDATQRLVDARAAPRFRGEVEPLDPVAGHVPGAVNRPFTENLDAGGYFKPAAVLRAEWLHLLGDIASERVVHMCGSGVTACHNLLAMEHAGLHGSALFPPSWSGWISDRARAIATGDA